MQPWVGNQFKSLNFCSLDNSLEKAVAPHSSTLAWKIPWMEEPGRLQSMGLLRVGHNCATSLSLFTFMHWRRKWQQQQQQQQILKLKRDFHRKKKQSRHTSFCCPSLYCTSQTPCFIQTEGLRQP